jgi:hypothetical protein
MERRADMLPRALVYGGLVRSLRAPMSAKDTTKLTSFLHRQVWWLYPELTGRAFRLEDIHDPKVQTVVKKFVKTFLPELQRMANKQTKKGAK